MVCFCSMKTPVIKKDVENARVNVRYENNIRMLV